MNIVHKKSGNMERRERKEQWTVGSGRKSPAAAAAASAVASTADSGGEADLAARDRGLDFSTPPLSAFDFFP